MTDLSIPVPTRNEDIMTVIKVIDGLTGNLIQVTFTFDEIQRFLDRNVKMTRAAWNGWENPIDHESDFPGSEKYVNGYITKSTVGTLSAADKAADDWMIV